MTTRKYSFTLMEVMVGFAMISLVLGTIFSSLYQETILKTTIDKMEETVMTRVETQQFLARVFSNLVSTNMTQGKEAFSSSKNELHVSFDNGIDPEPSFCKAIKGTLLKEDGNFIFKLYGNKGKNRKIILRKNIDSLSFEFLANKEKGMKHVATWDGIDPSFPYYTKIILDKNEAYAFWVNQTDILGIRMAEIDKKATEKEKK